MPRPGPLSALLACPRCGKGPLAEKEQGYSCRGCRVDFPSVDGIPWLFAEPGASLGEWRERLHLVLQRLERDAKRCEAELDKSDLHDLTKQRLEHLRDAYRDHARRMLELLAPLSMIQMQANYATLHALRTRMPSHQGISTYYVNVHRDWNWGEEENQASFDLVSSALEKGEAEPPGKTLVLGAGACRLAYDLHRRRDPKLMVALDINPFLLLLAQRVMRGETVELYEFPLAPRSIEDHAVLRKLSAEEPVGDGFHFVFGDVGRAPFIEGSFDTVITPWLIDIVSEDLRQLAPRLNGLLRTGGRWINFGSLSFTHSEQARCYSLEETLALIQDAGFAQLDVPDVEETTIPYISSPASRHGRRETVITFSATKTDAAARPPRASVLPNWIVKGNQPVPLLPSFQIQAMSTRIHAFIMAMIDGQRSLKQMADLLVEQRLMTREEAEPAIRSFLIKMYEESQRQTDL